MSGQNEDQTSRRKFLKGAGLVGAATVATPAARRTFRRMGLPSVSLPVGGGLEPRHAGLL